MRIEVKMRVINDDEWPVYENKYTFDNPKPTAETENFKYYRFRLNYAEPKEAVYLVKPGFESEKNPEGNFQKKTGEFSTKINQDLGILGE